MRQSVLSQPQVQLGNISNVLGVPNAPLSSAGGVLKGKTAGIKARIAKITTELNLMKQ